MTERPPMNQHEENVAYYRAVSRTMILLALFAAAGGVGGCWVSVHPTVCPHCKKAITYDALKAPQAPADGK